jgi:hypothetical protein
MERMRCSLTGSTRCEMEREKAVEFIKGRGVGIRLHRLGVSRFKKKKTKKERKKKETASCFAFVPIVRTVTSF